MWIDWLYAILSLLDSSVLFVWGVLDLRKFRPSSPDTRTYRRDGLILIFLGTLGFAIYGLGRMKENAQIAEAQKAIAPLQADIAKAQVKANELELSNTQLRIDLAKLQESAANAKAAQLKVEVDLAKQQARAAKAEQQLAAIRNPRKVPANILPALRAVPPGKARMAYQTGDPETFAFAMSLWHTLIEAGWQVEVPRPATSTEALLVFTGDMPIIGHLKGFSPMRLEIALTMGNLAMKPKHIEALCKALEAANISKGEYLDPTIPQETALIVIGPKVL